jgi:protein tyrosine phosphatase (PTP) superfamily phosphohydrolase (DUF442 family)
VISSLQQETTMSTESIYNYIQVNEQISTGGMPTADQIRDAAAEGFAAVINLATFETGYSLEGEAELVQSLGMAYYSIPVVWSHPTEEDFFSFEAALNKGKGRKILIHCAANYRVTAFYSLYGLKNLGWTRAQAQDFRSQIWHGSNHPIWEDFIQRMENTITAAPR